MIHARLLNLTPFVITLALSKPSDIQITTPQRPINSCPFGRLLAKFATKIGADGFASDAGSASRVAKALLGVA